MRRAPVSFHDASSSTRSSTKFSCTEAGCAIPAFAISNCDSCSSRVQGVDDNNQWSRCGKRAANNPIYPRLDHPIQSTASSLAQKTHFLNDLRYDACTVRSLVLSKHSKGGRTRRIFCTCLLPESRRSYSDKHLNAIGTHSNSQVDRPCQTARRSRSRIYLMSKVV